MASMLAAKLGACRTCITLAAGLFLLSAAVLLVAAGGPPVVTVLAGASTAFFGVLLAAHAVAYLVRRVRGVEPPPCVGCG